MAKNNDRKRVLVTGASGFIGRNLCAFLKKSGYFVRGTGRRDGHDISWVNEYIQVGEINEKTNWQPALAGVDTVIHLAARVHIMRENAADSLEEFRRVNALGTKHLARMAVEAGVKRFIFTSSVKVNGEGRQAPYTEEDVPAPEDAYGVSKLEAEQVLAQIAAETGFEVTILRLPLVYGPGVKANFRNLIKLVSCRLPIPFKSIKNRRSFLYIGNLIDVIMICLRDPKAVGQTFLVSDGQDVAVPDLIRIIAKAMGKRAILFSLPLGLLKMLCKIVGKTEVLEKLTGSLCVDIGKIRNLLNWNPPFTIEEGIKEALR